MFKKTVLDNGTRVITEEIPYVNTVSVGFWVEVGSRDERDTEQGYCHYLEHMLFKGTKRRTALQLAREVDAYGAYINASTDREITSFYINSIAERLDHSIDILADMLNNSIFDEKEMEREKQVVLEELKMTHDTPDDYIHEMAMKAVWPNNPIGRPIPGTEESINGIHREDLIRFYTLHYTAENLVIAVTGKCNHEKVVAAVQKAGVFTKAASFSPQRIPPEFGKTGNSENRDLQQVYYYLSMPGLSQRDERRFALYIVNSLFGSSMSSILFQEVRERLGLCYSIYSFLSNYHDTGLFTITCSTSNRFFKPSLEAVLRCCSDVYKNGISDDDIIQAKQQLKGHLALAYESVEFRMTRIAKQELTFGRYFTFDEMAGLIDTVTKDNVIDSIAYLFGEDRPCLISTLGPEGHSTIVREIGFQ